MIKLNIECERCGLSDEHKFNCKGEATEYLDNIDSHSLCLKCEEAYDLFNKDWQEYRRIKYKEFWEYNKNKHIGGAG